MPKYHLTSSSLWIQEIVLCLPFDIVLLYINLWLLICFLWYFFAWIMWWILNSLFLLLLGPGEEKKTSTLLLKPIYLLECCVGDKVLIYLCLDGTGGGVDIQVTEVHMHFSCPLNLVSYVHCFDKIFFSKYL
jgi:hypothetical protein